MAVGDRVPAPFVCRHRPYPMGSWSFVSVENVVGLVVALSLVGYLVAALIRPEKF